MRKSLYFGGSFNPIHHGHLICCRAAAESGGYDRVVLIPAGDPWQKRQTANLAAASHRLSMTASAIQGTLGLEADAIEVHRQGPSYTVDTVQELLDRGEPAVDWLIGADTMNRLGTWHDADRLMKLVQFRVMQRPGTVVDLSKAPPGCRVTPIATPLIDISATDIRQRIAEGLPIDFLTPSPVVRYISQHGLYRNP